MDNLELEDIQDCLTELECNGSENMYEVLVFLLKYLDEKEDKDG